MSCELARELSMTKMFSSFSNSMAGSLSGKFNGIAITFIYLFAKVRKKMNCHSERSEESRVHPLYVTEILRRYTPLNDK
jgi:hypothetical protein